MTKAEAIVLKKKPGIQSLRIHDFRRYFTSEALRKTANIAALSKLLGHKSTKVTTEIYHHLNFDDAIDIVTSIDLGLAKSTEGKTITGDAGETHSKSLESRGSGDGFHTKTTPTFSERETSDEAMLEEAVPTGVEPVLAD